jgi:hypothetical protein
MFYFFVSEFIDIALWIMNMCTLYVVFVQHLGSDSAVMMDSLEFIDEACNGFVPGLAESSRLFYHLFNDYEGIFICPLLL